jgi:hypothetical protein
VVAILGYTVATPFGDAAQTLRALADRQAGGGSWPVDRPLADQLASFLAPAATDPPDCCLLATTKGDAPRWCDSLFAGGYAGGPADIAAEVGRILGCPAWALSGACASGCLALDEAVRLIRFGGRRRVLVVGADRPGAFVGDGFRGLGTIDPAGCRPFDADRAGLQLGEGLAAMLLGEGAADLHLVGSAAGCDANHLTGPCLDGRGLARVCRAALAGRTPALVVAHGTGTRQNDDAESLAYATLGIRCGVVGWKGLLGHSLATCGLIEAALACELLATGAPVPGTVGLTRYGCPGAIKVLPPGPHPPSTGPILSGNAGFGGLNGAVVVDRVPRRDPLPAPVAARRARRLVADHAGIAEDGGGRLLSWRTPADPGRLPRPGAREVIGRIDTSWGRMDTACRLQVVFAHLLAPPTGCAQVLLTDHGCAETDREVERDRRAGRFDPQRFAYTLPTTTIGEASIRQGLTGPGFALLGADEAEGRRCAARLLAAGEPAVLLTRLETDGPGPVAWAELWLPA